MTNVFDLHKKWLEEPEYVKAYEALYDEYELASSLIAARKASGLTQEELAARANKKQSYISRLESGSANPTFKILKELAEATGTQLKIDFKPLNSTNNEVAVDETPAYH